MKPYIKLIEKRYPNSQFFGLNGIYLYDKAFSEEVTNSYEESNSRMWYKSLLKLENMIFQKMKLKKL